MKLVDFSSLVQLGVGLHLGTALFQVVIEFARSPLERTLERLRDLATAKGLLNETETALDLLGDLETKSVQFFNDYRNVILGTAIVGIARTFLLSYISIEADQPVNGWIALFIVMISIVPAPTALTFLWLQWDKNTRRLRQRVSTLERKVIYTRSQPTKS